MFATALRLLSVCMLCALAFPPCTRAQDADAVSESVLTAAFPDRSISALVTHLAKHETFKRAILLMPGSPGIMKIQSAGSYGMKGNFLIRSRRVWLDPETVVLSVDAPSDQWGSFAGFFRSSPRYAEDIQGLSREIARKFGDIPLVIVGTSEGSLSAFYAARALSRVNVGPNAGPNVRVIFSSSLFNSTLNSPGLATLDFNEIKLPMLWVHHVDDPCQYTPYWQAKRHAEKTRSPLISVRSSDPGKGPACQAFTRHGYAGVERETVLAMKAWVVDGVAKDVEVP